jgi:hypothetical protein
MNFDMWVYAVFSAAVLGLAVDHFRMRGELSATRVSMAELRTFVAENYVRGHEIEKVYTEIGKLATTLDEAVKLLHELKGSHSVRG